ncbi:MAG: GGDEF domain-containing protein [Clostridiales bacterium]
MTNKDLSLITKIDKQKSNFFIFSRWFFLIFVLSIYCIQDIHSFDYIFFKIFFITILYNIFVTVYKFMSYENKKDINGLYAFLDVIIVCAYIFISGGVKSDLFVMFFFILSYNGIKSKHIDVNLLGIFTVVVYSIVCIIEMINTNNISYLINSIIKLISKDFIILLTTYGIYLLKIEVRRYDELHKKEFKLARTDKLTGLANRHYLDQKLLEEIDYCNYNNKNLNFLLFDLDNFKNFNDKFGHISGDKFLVLFADILKENIRKTDVAVRFGGEEFLILLRNTDNVSAKNIGERIRRQLEVKKIDVDEKNLNKKVTVSCGLAQYPTDSKNIKEVINCADKALYNAKESGKNMVVMFNDIKNKYNK